MTSHVNQILAICKEVGIEDTKAHNIVQLFLSSMPTANESIPLPHTLLTGFDPIDYLVAPLHSNSRIQIYGREGSAKTVLIAELVASLIRKYSVEVLWLDSTFKVEQSFFNGLGLGNNLSFCHTTNITSDHIEMLKQKRFRVIVVDDIAGINTNNNLERCFYLAKVLNLMIIAANQIRVIPTTGQIYGTKQDILKNFDITIHTSTYKIHDTYKDYNIKLEMHHGTGEFEGKNIIIPITKRGIIKHTLMLERLNAIAKVSGCASFSEYMTQRIECDKQRESKNNNEYIPNNKGTG
jgi:hypothetical protein